MTEVGRWMAQMREKTPEIKAELDALEAKLDRVRKEFGVEKIDLDGDNSIVGKVFRENEEI